MDNKINVTEGEVASMMKNVLDPEDNGYVDFQTFSKRFGVNMSSQINVEDKEVHLPNLAPNKAKLNEYGKKSEAVRDKIAEVTKKFKPEAELKLSTATRFSAKPAHANTFMNHYAGPNTPGF